MCALLCIPRWPEQQQTHCGSVNDLVKGGREDVCTLFPFPGSLGAFKTEALMALKTRSRSQSVGQDDSPEDILTEKYRSADGAREVDPSERRQGGGHERRRAVDYERDAGESHRRRCPSRPVPRGTMSLLRGDRCAHARQVEMRSAAARGMVDEGRVWG
jgi:hypothetical protein